MEMLVTKMLYQVTPTGTNVYIYGRTDKGKRRMVKLIGIRPYFYTRVDPGNHEAIRQVEQRGQDLLNRKLFKVFTKIPKDVRRIRDNYDYHYEADIPFTDRARIDCGIRSQINIPDEKTITKTDITPVKRTINPEILYIDIETDDSKGFARSEYAAHPVRCVAMYSTEYDSYIMIIEGDVDKDKIRAEFKEMCQKHFGDDGPSITFKSVYDETGLFQKLRDVILQISPDIITGWNVDNYDVMYLQNRAASQFYSRLDFRIYAIFDLMKGYDRLHIGKSYMKLEHVGQKELGVGKLKREKISEMFRNNREKLCLYNIWDVELCRRIDIARNIIHRHLTFAWFAGADLEKSYHSEPLFDKYILHEVAGKVVLPSKDMLKKTGVDKGAHVHEPVKGRFVFVGMLDFASMYPKTIMSFNISPETRLPDDYEGDDAFCLPSGRKYKKAPVGFIPLIVERLMGVRDGVKEEMKQFQKGTPEYKRKYEEQTAIKYFINSAYGIMGSEVFRLADGDVASDVTHVGRVLIQYTMEQVKQMGYTPLYADTDSVFFETHVEDTGQGVEVALKEAVEIAKDVEIKLNNLYPVLASEWNGEHECDHHIKCEIVYEAWIQGGTKKRHAGLIGWDLNTDEHFITHLPPEDRLDVKGFEIVRANVAQITKVVQKDVLLTALTEKDYWSALSQYIIKLKDNFYEGKLDSQMLIPSSWSKMEYMSSPAHHRAMQYSEQNGLLDLQPGDPYSWLYVLRVDGKPPTDVVALDLDTDVIPDIVKIDYDKMWQRCIEKPLSRILDSVGVRLNELLSGKRQSTLATFEQPNL